ALPECADDFRQRVARLRVRRGDGKATGFAVGEIAAHPLEVLRLVKHAFDDFQHGFTGLGEADETLAAALDYQYRELSLQLFGLLGDARLRGKERVRGFGEAHVAPYRVAHIAKFLEVHLAISLLRYRL